MPRTNTNDDVVVVRRWAVPHGQWVQAGDIIADIETSKALIEIEAPESGYVFHHAKLEAQVAVGAPIAWLVDDPATEIVVSDPAPVRPDRAAGGRLISHEAADLLAKHDLTAETVGGTGALRKRDVEAFLSQRSLESHQTDWPHIVANLMVNEWSTLIFGGDAQGAVVHDCLESHHPGSATIFVDDRPRRTELLGVPVLPAAALPAIRERGIKRAHISIAAAPAKELCARRLQEAGFEIVQVRHASASVAASARIGTGVFLGPLSLVGPLTTIEDFVQINNAASVAHHCIVRRGARISDGVRLAGSVVVGEGAFLGLGVTVNEKIEIGARATVVSGVSVFNHVPPDSIVRVDGKAYPVVPIP